MADEITSKCATLTITEAESTIVKFDDKPDNLDDTGIYLSLVGKVLTNRSYIFEAMKKTLNQICRSQKEDYLGQ